MVDQVPDYNSFIINFKSVLSSVQGRSVISFFLKAFEKGVAGPGTDLRVMDFNNGVSVAREQIELWINDANPELLGYMLALRQKDLSHQRHEANRLQQEAKNQTDY